MHEYFVAIDSGGSKCESLFLSADGTVRGFSRFEENGVSGRSDKAIVESAHAAMKEAVPERISVITYVGKYHSLLKHLGFRLFPPDNRPGRSESMEVIITREECSGFAMCGEDSGIVLLSGTGAFVSGRNPEGRECHYDGLGPVVGDDGSGHYIGMRALRAVARSNWHPRRKTSLTDQVLSHLGFSSVDEVVSFSLAHPDRAVVSSLARIVNAEAEQGDGVSARILREAAAAVCETLYDVVETLGMSAGKHVLIGLGGIVTGSRIYWDEVVRTVAGMAPDIECRIERRPLVIGVAASGMRTVLGLDAAKTRELADKIGKSYYAFIAGRETKK